MVVGDDLLDEKISTLVWNEKFDHPLSMLYLNYFS